MQAPRERGISLLPRLPIGDLIKVLADLENGGRSVFYRHAGPNGSGEGFCLRLGAVGTRAYRGFMVARLERAPTGVLHRCIAGAR